MQAPAPGERQWLPLESNPDVVSTFSHRMGASPLWKVDPDSCSRLVRTFGQAGARRAPCPVPAARTVLTGKRRPARSSMTCSGPILSSWLSSRRPLSRCASSLGVFAGRVCCSLPTLTWRGVADSPALPGHCSFEKDSRRFGSKGRGRRTNRERRRLVL